MREFYGYFAAAYGTCWLATILVAVLSRDHHVDLGAFGALGFPIIALVYAWYRKGAPAGSGPRSEIDHLQQRIYQLERELARQG